MLAVRAGLWHELAYPGRPVSERRAQPGGAGRRGTGAKLVVTAGRPEEAPSPCGVVARVGDVLAGDPDRVAVNGRRTVVAPARADGVREPLRLVTGEAVVHCGTIPAWDD